jgi:phosphopantothenoylcysteine decarboxylase/phosphopantothenate--cysteine ligase
MKRVLLVIGGGVAAYKSLDLIRRLKERGVAARVVLTQAAKAFVTPLSAAALSGDRTYDELFSLTDEDEMGHIQLSRQADLVVVAPATADLMAKMAQGLANDLASTLLLATDKRVLIAPAMNVRMWLHPATRRNLATLRADGVLVVGPNEGEMACGEFGPGRMAEPAEIVAAVEAALAEPPRLATTHALTGPRAGGLKTVGPLSGRTAVVTAGPTHEPIDPVRYIANRSSGKQGYALAKALADLGARVRLISGPVALPDPAGVEVVRVETARQMLTEAEAALPADVFVAAAAVADWRVAQEGEEKIKKRPGEAASLALVENPDILATLSRRGAGRPRLVVGFAAETEHVVEHAKAKLARKGCDVIVANDVSPETGVMGGDRNRVHVVTSRGVEDWPDLSKEEVAARLAAMIAARLGEEA